MKILAPLAVLGLTALPALADDMMDVSKMTCAQYMALDDAGKMSAMEAIEAAHSAMSSDATATDTMSSDATTDTMASDDAATDTMSSDTMSSDTMAADNPMVAQIMTGCDGHPDMMATDAMGSM